MKGRPWLELALVILLLAGGVLLVRSLPGEMPPPQRHSAVEEGGHQHHHVHAHHATLELRSVHAMESFQVDILRVAGDWETVLKSDEAGMSQEFASLEAEIFGEAIELRVRAVWPEAVEESMLELKFQLGSDLPVTENLWGSGEIEEVLRLPLAGHKHGGGHDH